jgi:hypothetical protein
MMADDTQGSVATSVADIRSLGSQEAPETQPSAPVAPSPNETPDYKAMYEAAETKRTVAENKAKEWEGRSRNLASADDIAEISAQMALLRRGLKDANDPNLDPDERYARVEQIDQEAAASAASRQSVAEANGILGDIKTLLADAGLSDSDERFNDAVALWEDGRSGEVDLQKLNRSFRLFSSEIYRYQKTQTEEARQTTGRRQQQDSLQLDGGAGPAVGAGKTEFTAAEIDSMSPGDYAKNREHIVK